MIHDNSILLERHIQVFTVCITNMFALPAIYICYRNGMMGECVIGFMTILTSTLYHLCETCHIMIWGMNDGRWHRLDNVFIILSLQNLFIFMLLNSHVKYLSNGSNLQLSSMKAHVKNERKMAQLFRFMGLAHCLTCQEKAPWDEYYTYLPICTIFICCVLRFIFNDKHYRPSYDWKKMLCGLFCMLIATYFFVIGLDERNDYIEIPHSKSNIKVWRINHGLWHVFVSIAFFFFYYAKREFYKEKRE